MAKRIRVGCLGELVVDFIAHEPADSVHAARQFYMRPGGSPANVAAGLIDEMIEPVLISRIGRDPFGQIVREAVRKAGLDDAFISVDESYPTRCVFMTYDVKGQRSVAIANRVSADQFMPAEQVVSERMGKLDLLHVGGTSILGAATGNAMQNLVQGVKCDGGHIAFDLNIKYHRIATAAKERLHQLLPYIDILKANEEEWGILEKLFAQEAISHPTIVVITKGENGAEIRSAQGEVQIEAVDTDVKDPTGAGDAFFTGFLKMMMLLHKPPARLSTHELKVCGEEGAKKAGKIINCLGGMLANAPV